MCSAKGGAVVHLHPSPPLREIGSWYKAGAIISPMEFLDLVAYSYEQGKRVLENRKAETLKENGQFLTPPSIARYMTRQLGQIQNGAFLLHALANKYA